MLTRPRHKTYRVDPPHLSRTSRGRVFLAFDQRRYFQEDDAEIPAALAMSYGIGLQIAVVVGVELLAVVVGFWVG